MYLDEGEDIRRVNCTLVQTQYTEVREHERAPPEQRPRPLTRSRIVDDKLRERVEGRVLHAERVGERPEAFSFEIDAEGLEVFKLVEVEVAVAPHDGEGGEKGRLAESVENTRVRQRIQAREGYQVAEWALVNAVAPGEQVTRGRSVIGWVANPYRPGPIVK